MLREQRYNMLNFGAIRIGSMGKRVVWVSSTKSRDLVRTTGRGYSLSPYVRVMHHDV